MAVADVSESLRINILKLIKSGTFDSTLFLKIKRDNNISKGHLFIFFIKCIFGINKIYVRLYIQKLLIKKIFV